MRGKSPATNRRAPLRMGKSKALGLPTIAPSGIRLIKDTDGFFAVKTKMIFSPAEADELLYALKKYLKTLGGIEQGNPLGEIYLKAIEDYQLNPTELKSGEVYKTGNNFNLDMVSPLSRTNSPPSSLFFTSTPIQRLFKALDEHQKLVRTPKRKENIKAIMNKIALAHEEMAGKIKSKPFKDGFLKLNGKDMQDMNKLLAFYMSNSPLEIAKLVDRNWANSMIPVWELDGKPDNYISFMSSTSLRNGLLPFNLTVNERQYIKDMLVEMTEPLGRLTNKLSPKMKEAAWHMKDLLLMK